MTPRPNPIAHATDLAELELAKSVMTGAKKYIEAGWTQGTYAINRDGAEVKVGDETAVCHCTLGALMHAKLDHHLSADAIPYATNQVLRFVLNEVGLALWNNTAGRRKDQVVAAFQRGIETLTFRITQLKEAH